MSTGYTDSYIDFSRLGEVNVKQIIEKNGFAVITNVITRSRADEYVTRIWDWLEGTVSGIDRHDPDSWFASSRVQRRKLREASILDPDALDAVRDAMRKRIPRIITGFAGVSHVDLVWDARTEPNVGAVFQNIWKTDKLLVSFDGICVTFPQTFIEHYVSLNESWFHVGKSPMKKGLHYVQGYLNFQDITKQDFLMVYPTSNKYNEILKMLGFYNNDNEWFKLLEAMCLYPEKIVAPKGSLVLWDSRTVHCSYPNGSNNNICHAINICMVPRNRATSKALAGDRRVQKKRIVTKSRGVWERDDP